MAKGRHLFTSESVTEGHPDKMCDQISDAILDAIMKEDPMGRVAVEALVTNGVAVIAGEVTTGCYVDIPSIVRKTIKDIGYVSRDIGFDYETSGVPAGVNVVDNSEGLHLGFGGGFRIALNENFIIAIDRGYVADERDGASGLYIALDWLF